LPVSDGKKLTVGRGEVPGKNNASKIETHYVIEPRKGEEGGRFTSFGVRSGQWRRKGKNFWGKPKLAFTCADN